MKLNEFSVVSTNVTLDKSIGLITKKYLMNVDLGISTIHLKGLVDKYFLSIKEADIPIPEILQSYIEDELLVYETIYCGQNIIELGFDVSKFSFYKTHINKMLETIKLAIKSNIHFDPHPKNFVFDDNDEIRYVDFFPPYDDYLKSKRLHYAAQDEVQLIKENFKFFTKDFLVEHFCGDFLNIDKSSELIFEEIFQMAKDIGIYSDSFENFKSKAKNIRRVEDTRLQRKIFLL